MDTNQDKTAIPVELHVYDLDTESEAVYQQGEIPDKHLWAYRHIIRHDCGSISCGRTVFHVVAIKPNRYRCGGRYFGSVQAASDYAQKVLRRKKIFLAIEAVKPRRRA